MPLRRPRSRTRARLWLLPLLMLLTFTSPAAAESTVDVMARAMARMMEAMGLFDEGGSMGPMSFGTGVAPGIGQVPWQYSPWSSNFTDPFRAFGMQQMMPQMQGMPGFSATTLDGIWEGRDGGLLIIRGQRFRLQSARGGHLDGLIQQRGDRVALYEPSSDTVRPYEFVEQQGRLILRDPAGKLYLYRRLWLDE